MQQPFLAAWAGTLWAVLWYVGNFAALRSDAERLTSAVGLTEGDPQGFGLASALFYARALVQVYAWLPTLAVAVIVLVWRITGTTRGWTAMAPLRRSWSFIAVAAMLVIDVPVLMVMSNKDVRYCSPLLLAVALTLAGLTDTAANGNAGRAPALAAWAFSAIAIFNTVELTLPIGTWSGTVRSVGVDLPVIGSHGYTRGRPQGGDFVMFRAAPAAAALLRHQQANHGCVGPTAVAASGGSNDLYTNRGSADGLLRLIGVRRAIDLERPCVLLILAVDSSDLLRSTGNGRYRIVQRWYEPHGGLLIAAALRVR